MEQEEIICSSGKSCFKTRAEIKAYIDKCNERKGGDGFRYYRCSECGHWHLTTCDFRYSDYELKKKSYKYNRLIVKRDEMKIYRTYNLAV